MSLLFSDPPETESAVGEDGYLRHLSNWDKKQPACRETWFASLYSEFSTWYILLRSNFSYIVSGSFEHLNNREVSQEMSCNKTAKSIGQPTHKHHMNFVYVKSSITRSAEEYMQLFDGWYWTPPVTVGNRYIYRVWGVRQARLAGGRCVCR